MVGPPGAFVCNKAAERNDEFRKMTLNGETHYPTFPCSEFGSIDPARPRDDAGGNLHRSAGHPAEADEKHETGMHRFVENDDIDGDECCRGSKESAGRTEQFDGIGSGT